MVWLSISFGKIGLILKFFQTSLGWKGTTKKPWVWGILLRGAHLRGKAHVFPFSWSTFLVSRAIHTRLGTERLKERAHKMAFGGWRFLTSAFKPQGGGLKTPPFGGFPIATRKVGGPNKEGRGHYKTHREG